MYIQVSLSQTKLSNGNDESKKDNTLVILI